MIQEPIIVGEHTPYPLNGLLTLPDHAARPVPAVVFVHGSGSSNMDEKVGKLTPFRDLAQGLAAHGIASIRYNKRSFSHGWAMLRDKSKPLTVREETIEDALLATELLRKDPRIDPEQVFLLGHSMGGMLAPRIDAEGGNYKGLILMAGTPRRLEEVLIEQTEESLAALKGAAPWLAEKQLRKLRTLFDGLYDLPDAAAMKRKVGGGTTLYYFKEMGEHPAADYLTALEKPILIMQGEKDVQVRADRDFSAYRQILAGRTNAEFRLYEGLNHAFVPAVSDTIRDARKEFRTERHIHPDIIADIASWITAVSAG